MVEHALVEERLQRALKMKVEAMAPVAVPIAEVVGSVLLDTATGIAVMDKEAKVVTGAVKHCCECASRGSPAC